MYYFDLATNSPLGIRFEKGMAVIELVIILPLMLVLLFGTIEMGFAFFRYNELNKSVRDGTRYLTLNSKDTDIAGNLVKYGIITTGTTFILPGSEPIVVVVDTDTLPGYLQVTATYTHHLILGNLLQNLTNYNIGPDFNFVATSIMRIQQ